MQEEEQKVLNVLTFHDWKEPFEIGKETNLSIETIYPILRVFEKKEFIVSRVKEISEERLRARNGRCVFEYRLIQGGVREKDRIKDNSAASGSLTLLPQTI